MSEDKSTEPVDLGRSLEEAILACSDERTLSALLDQQALVAEPSARLDAYLRKLIDDPVPFLTAKVFRVYRLTGSTDVAILEAAASYLSLGCYDGDWYDEAINSIGWANEHLAEGTESRLVIAYRQLLEDAKAEDHQELLEFCRGYER